MEALILALALFCVPPAPSTTPGCFCESCTCGPDCRCSSGVCACPGCQQTSGVAQKSPAVSQSAVKLTLVTTFDGNCPGCERMKPAWEAVAAANSDVCETIDANASPEYVRSLGVYQWPTLLLTQDGRRIYAWPAKVYAQNQIEWMTERARARNRK